MEKKMSRKSLGKFLGLVTFAAMAVTLATGCSFREVKQASTSSASESTPAEVKAALDRCLLCHTGSGAPNGFVFSYDLDQLAASGKVIKGDATNSWLFRKIIPVGYSGASPIWDSSGENDRMPANGDYLDPADIEVVKNWINGTL